MNENENENESAFAFEGNWRDYAPIAFTNLLLTIVTFGIYRFWATTRTRSYLWSRTRFIDDHLEWTGSGKELFIGFLMALLVFGLPLVILNFAIQAAALRGYWIALAFGGITFYLAIQFVFGVARFRALRYRLSRTLWHGIRGGSDDQGFRYGLSSIGKMVIGIAPLGLLIPWSMTSLWNERWGAMTFGPHRFESHARAGGLFGRWLLFYLLPVFLVIFTMAAAATFQARFGNMVVFSERPGVAIVLFLVVALCVYAIIGLVTLAYYSAFFREAVSNMSLTGIEFEFEATSSDWLNLILIDALLVVCTLGIGLIFLSYRHWAFFIRHLEATGEIDLDLLTQSATRTPTQGEGLLDALDVGAF
jgi:uncharacterized membrane protein YjgN (DUF898 family)